MQTSSTRKDASAIPALHSFSGCLLKFDAAMEEER